jgi:hypothetical protein
MTGDEITRTLNEKGPAWARQYRPLIIGWLTEVYGEVVLTPEQRAKCRTFAPNADLDGNPFDIILDEAIRQTELQTTCTAQG